MIEAAGDGRVAEAEIAQQRLDRRRIGAGDPPVRGRLMPCADANWASRAGVSLRASKPTVSTLNRSGPITRPRVGDRIDQVLGGGRADRTAGGVDEADHQRLAAIGAQRERRAARVGQRVVAERAPDRRFAPRRSPCCGSSRSALARRREPRRSSARTRKREGLRARASGHGKLPAAASSSAPATSSASCSERGEEIRHRRRPWSASR